MRARSSVGKRGRHPPPWLARLSTVFIGLSLAACGAAPAGQASAAAPADVMAVKLTIKRHYAAAGGGSGTTACATVAGPARAQLIKLNGGAVPGAPPECERLIELRARELSPGERGAGRVRLGRIRITGDTARARVEGGLLLTLVRRDAGWVIFDFGRVFRELAAAFARADASTNSAFALDCATFSLTPGAWSRAGSGGRAPTERQRLADALIKCRTLIGKTAGEVRSLLGRPDSEARDLIYTTGPERGFVQIDSEILVVVIGRAGRVRDVQLGQN